MTTEVRNIMQAFRVARKTADSGVSPEDKIKAYKPVVDFCSGNDFCRADRSLKRKVILFWVCYKMGEAFEQKQDSAQALLYFEKSLKFARSHADKAALLNKILELQKKLTIKVKRN